MANFSRTDLDFLLQQIAIADADSAAQQQPNPIFNALPGLVGDPLLPFGLRNVDGTYNNLEDGQSLFGAADRVFPRLLAPEFRPGENIPTGFPGAGNPTHYNQKNGLVFDSQPRLISNLIVDQTATNPAAVIANDGADPVVGTRADGVTTFETFFIPNTTPDEGLSAPFNSWFTLFGQFFDHGLDLVNKGQSGTVFVPLQPGDPLFDPTEGAPNFMTLTRATNLPGGDGVIGTGDDIHNHTNQTTPFVDQNQTYTSHPSHQVFLREYAINPNTGDPVSTGNLLEGSGGLGGLATWADIKAQAHTMLGLKLTDADLTNLPLLATDTYGKFIPGANGYAQLVLPGNVLLEGNPAANGGSGVNIPSNVVRTGHAFLDDIAHTAVPKFASGLLNPDPDPDTGNTPAAGTYDDELLDRHFITGDGRGNENIGLTTVHTVFHAEHNRKVQEIKDLITDSLDPAFINQWKLPGNQWDGEKLFQAARFATEMQYQHLVFEEFARKVQPNVDVFIGYDSTIDPAIMAEFAHVVYRFGHSMLTETVARTNANGGNNDIGLIQAFLNPVEFADDYTNNLDAAAAVVRGMTKQVGNEIDEFVTEALRNNLVGLPLDLATINMTRARDTGIPGLNDARRMFFDDSGLSAVAPYVSWADFGAELRHPESLVNFIAAYGNHSTLDAATTNEEKRAAAQALIAENGDFLNSDNGFTTANTGLDSVDFWIGGLAEAQAPFGGLLGSTFNFVFETQMENLQNGDRFYYLARTAGLDFLTQLEENSFAEMIMRNLPNVKHLPFDVFSTPTYTFEAGNLLVNPTGIFNDPSTPYNESALLVRDTSLGPNTIRYNGGEHIVMGGTDGVNRLRAGIGDDTVWGDGGNDRIEGSAGNDSLNGGDGNDIITDTSGDDNIKGGDGHDVINGGAGINLILGGSGHDFVISGNDISEVFAGPGNDFIFGNAPNEVMQGNEGDDWIQTGTADGSTGDNFDPFNRDPIRGNDVFVGSGGLDEFIGEGGDEVMMGLAGADRNDGGSGFDWTANVGSTVAANVDLARLLVPGPFVDTADRFDLVEAASGWNQNDTIRGDDRTSTELELIDPNTGQNNALDNVNQLNGTHTAAERIGMIDGLSAFLNGATSFSSGNILMGGGGSDLIEGRGGDDLIDGDAWLNVRISARANPNNPASEIQSFPNMTPALRTAMQNGTYSPDQLVIVREILSNSTGVDTALYGDVFANYVVNVDSTGTIFVDHANPVVGDDGSDRIRNVERLQFADRIVTVGTNGDDNMVGTAGNDVLLALGGNDTLDGLGGVDILNGGPGDDTYTVDTTTDTIIELAGVGSGIDTVASSVTYTLGLNLENLTLTGTAPNGTGNNVGNVITGNASNNILTGLGGDDTLIAGGGTDTLRGGLNNDTYVISNLPVTITELLNQGTDTVESPVTYTLLANVENLTLTGGDAINGTGNGLANILTGNSNNNTLNGGAGLDTLNGGDGNDTLNGAAGIDILDGGNGADTLIGGPSADTLIGGAGADIFDYLVAVAHSNPANRDTIMDFETGIDTIDLSAIDANATAGFPGDQAFTFRGALAFTGAAQVRYDPATGLLQANINGTAAPEFEILLAGAPTLVVGDLVL